MKYVKNSIIYFIKNNNICFVYTYFLWFLINVLYSTYLPYTFIKLKNVLKYKNYTIYNLKERDDKIKFEILFLVSKHV